ncbi:MAG: HlyC/CorC family transporter [Pirellulales bacterium]|nr:HlyC/CorC family transporter [Pirellulales bacterium]
MTGAILVWLSLATLAVACFSATAVQSLRDFSRSKLRDRLRSRGQEPRYDQILENSKRAELGAESLRVIASAAAVLAAAASMWESHAGAASLPQTLAVIIAQMLAGATILWLAIVWFPTAVAGVWAEPFLARTWPLWKASGKILGPSVIGARLVQQALHRLTGKKKPTLTEEELEAEIREVVSEGQREGLLEEDAREMIESVIALGEVVVSEIMTPRTEVISMSADLSWSEALHTIISSGHTRIPVYGKSRDHVVGILHIKDLLPELMREQPAARKPIVGLLRPPFFVPETKAVDELLQEFQHSRSHIAVVLDEFGGVSGVVTIEDVLEEIVGEISDEHDEAAGDGFKSRGENKFEAFARMKIYEINQRLGTGLPEDADYGTIGGLVFHELGRIPHAGEALVAHGVRIEVLEATRRRINRVLIEVQPLEQPVQQAKAEVE